MDSECRKGIGACRSVIERGAYALAIPVYRLAIRLAALKDRKARLLNEGQDAVWDHLSAQLDPAGGYIWVHCASLGEFEQGRPLMERIRRDHPELKILLTFFSPSGYEVRKNYPGADVISYLPLDVPGAASRFLGMVRPRMAVFVKYELWRNYLVELRHRKIPSFLISAIFRPEQSFFRKRGAWYAQWLRTFTRIYVQNEASRRLLSGIGICDVKVAGDTRFDRVADIRDAARRLDILDRFAGRRGSAEHSSPVFIAGSSWPEDEAVYAAWLNSRTGVKGIIAPHEFDAGRLDKLKRLFGRRAVLKSEVEADPSLLPSAEILIIDCFGLLSSAYAYADVAYVGGGFGEGIHNVNEAAAFGIPVLFGPNHTKFAEAIDLKTLGGGIAVNGRGSFESAADKMVFDRVECERRGRWAAEYISEKTGATDIIFNDLFR